MVQPVYTHVVLNYCHSSPTVRNQNIAQVLSFAMNFTTSQYYYQWCHSIAVWILGVFTNAQNHTAIWLVMSTFWTLEQRMYAGLYQTLPLPAKPPDYSCVLSLTAGLQYKDMIRTAKSPLWLISPSSFTLPRMRGWLARGALFEDKLTYFQQCWWNLNVSGRCTSSRTWMSKRKWYTHKNSGLHNWPPLCRRRITCEISPVFPNNAQHHRIL